MNDTMPEQLLRTKASHLDDQEFCECLAQTPGARAAAHLEACESCRLEAANAQESLANVRLASHRWSETRAARVRVGLPALRPAHAARLAFAGVLLAVLAPAGMYLATHTEHRQGAVAKTPGNDSAGEIARDNDLLLAVNRELDESVAPAMQPLLLSPSDTQPSTRHAQTREERQTQ
jgi:hypothetical protein